MLTRGYKETLRFLRDGGFNCQNSTDSDRTALHRACANGHDQVVAYLISQGAAVEVEADGDRFLDDVGFGWRHGRLM